MSVRAARWCGEFRGMGRHLHLTAGRTSRNTRHCGLRRRRRHRRAILAFTALLFECHLRTPTDMTKAAQVSPPADDGAGIRRTRARRGEVMILVNHAKITAIPPQARVQPTLTPSSAGSEGRQPVSDLLASQEVAKERRQQRPRTARRRRRWR